jgi:hypothetical protein
MTRDQVLLQAWAFGCLIVGPALILTGAREAGLAVLGSIVGSVVGELVVTSFDSLPYSTAFGATIGTVMFGLAGLHFRSPAKRSTLLVLGGLVVLLGVAAVLGVHLLWGSGLCFHPHKGHRYTSCLPAKWDSEMQMLFLFNGAFVAFLCLVQAAQATLRYRVMSARTRMSTHLAGRKENRFAGDLNDSAAWEGTTSSSPTCSSSVHRTRHV